MKKEKKAKKTEYQVISDYIRVFHGVLDADIELEERLKAYTRMIVSKTTAVYMRKKYEERTK